MKKTIALTLSVLFVFFCLASCAKNSAKDDFTKEIPADGIPAEGIWKGAIYRNHETFGNGATTVEVEVKADEYSITFTIKTDKAILGEALLEHDLIAGEQSQYGLYIKVVNGITADYDVDQSYWALYKNGEYCMTGVDTTPIADGEHYELVYAK